MIGTGQSNIVELNVGGTPFTCLVTDLCKQPNSLLSQMFSQLAPPLERDSKGRIFLNFDAKAFRFILHFLRTDEFVLPDSFASRQIFFKTLRDLSIKSLLSDSIILNSHHISLLIPILPLDKSRLLYRASRDGWGTTDFHRYCDGIENTLVLVKVGSYVFGGFAPASWNKPREHVDADSQSFLFSLSNPSGSFLGVKLLNDASFGGGHDLHISHNANQNQASHTRLGSSYSYPSFAYGSIEVKTFFCGIENFQPTEVEVFALT